MLGEVHLFLGIFHHFEALMGSWMRGLGSMWITLDEEAEQDWVRNLRPLQHDFSKKSVRCNASILGVYLVILGL